MGVSNVLTGGRGGGGDCRIRGDEWSLRAFASIPSTAIFLRARAEIKNLLCEHASNAKFGEHEQASTRLNFASKSSKGKILRAVRNLNGPFITPRINVHGCSSSRLGV